jgi:hypothetical protein
MAAAARPGTFSTKPVDQLIESADTSKLRRAIGALDLTAFGLVIYAVYGFRHSKLRNP